MWKIVDNTKEYLDQIITKQREVKVLHSTNTGVTSVFGLLQRSGDFYGVETPDGYGRVLFTMKSVEYIEIACGMIPFVVLKEN